MLDKDGNIVPDASNNIIFDIDGLIAAVDNGDPVNHESFREKFEKAFNGLALVIIQSTGQVG